MVISERKKLVYLLFILLCQPMYSWSLDAACDNNATELIDTNSLFDIEYHIASELEIFANVYIQEKFMSALLSGVTIRYGSNKILSDKTIIPPRLTASLEIRKHENRSMVQVFMRKTNTDTVLSAVYGEICPIFAEVVLNPSLLKEKI